MDTTLFPLRTLAEASARRRRAGFTLIEVLVVLAVLGTLIGLGMPQFTALVASTRAKNAATDLHVALTKTRSEALKRNASVKLVPAAGGWQLGWQIRDLSDNVLDAHGPAGGVTINSTSGTADVVFQSSGRIQTVAPMFLVTAAASSSAVRCVSTDLSGRAYVKKSVC